MSRIWAIARHTISEVLRMRVVVIFIAAMGLSVVALPIWLRHENAVSDAVQSFLSFSLGVLSFSLSLLTIFLARSVSDEMVNRQILVLMTKPIPRWQYVVGKWLGIVTLNLGLVAGAGLFIYGGAKILSELTPRDELDRQRLTNEVMVARHGVHPVRPDFEADAERIFRERLEEGVYAEAVTLDEEQEKKRIANELSAEWITIPPGEARVFEFSNVRCPRDPEKRIQIRYKADLWSYPPDEILRCFWVIGNPDKGGRQVIVDRRDIISRFHTISVPADTVANDRTLTAIMVNQNPFLGVMEGEVPWKSTIAFATADNIELLFEVGTFGGNLVRQLSLLGCRLVFLSAVAVLAACLFSFPVACLVCFTFLALAAMAGFLDDAAFFLWQEGVEGIFRQVVIVLYKVVYVLVPKFSKYDGTSLLVDGRNVTLRWVMSGVLHLVLLGTSAVLMAACLVFQRREVAEVSV